MSKIIFLFLLGLAAGGAALRADPLYTLPGLQSVHIVEWSGGQRTVHQLNFFRMTRVNGSLGAGVFQRDFVTSENELYDAYFSDANGTAAYTTGEYITISAAYTGTGSGLNVDRVWLTFNNGRPARFANVVSSFAAGSAGGYVSGSEGLAVNPGSGTYSEMGRTAGGADRMSITVGFSQVPEPPAFAVFGVAALALLGQRRLRRSC